MAGSHHALCGTYDHSQPRRHTRTLQDSGILLRLGEPLSWLMPPVSGAHWNEGFQCTPMARSADQLTGTLSHGSTRPPVCYLPVQEEHRIMIPGSSFAGNRCDWDIIPDPIITVPAMHIWYGRRCDWWDHWSNSIAPFTKSLPRAWRAACCFGALRENQEG